MKVLGLDFKDLSVKVSVLEKKLGSIRILNETELQLPPDEDEKARLIAETLNALNSDFGPKGVVVGMDTAYFSHHFIELPVTSRDDISRALAFELEKYLPLSPDEYIYDFITVESSTSGSKVLVLALKKDRLSFITEKITESGLVLLGVKCSGMEALNELLATENAEGTLLIYKGIREHYIVGIRNTRPLILKSKGSPREVNIELRKLTETYNNGICTLDDVDESAVEGFETKALSYSVPALIAISAVKKRALTLNFMPEEYAARKISYYPYALIAMCAISVLTFFSTTWLSYYKDYSALASVNAQIDELTSTSSELMQTQKEFEKIDEKRQFLLKFQQRRNKHIKILRLMSRLLPKEAWLTNFSTDNRGRIEIQGYAARSANLIGPLEKSAIFKNVEFSSPVTIRNEQERFSIRMELEE